MWFLADHPKLSAAAKAAVEDPMERAMALADFLAGDRPQESIGKLPLPAPFGTLFPAVLVADDIHLLPIEPRHIEPLTTLPFHHNDPFDRLLVATSLVETMRLVSADAALDAYGVTRLW